MEIGKKVLVVDDDEALVRLIDQVLTRQGYEIAQGEQWAGSPAASV